MGPFQTKKKKRTQNRFEKKEETLSSEICSEKDRKEYLEN